MENEIENNILSFDDTPDLDVKIKPNYYIHMALIMAQKTLMISMFKGGISDGIIGFSVLVEHIEVLSRAANYIPDDYEKMVNDYKLEEDYIEAADNVKIAKLANKKIEFLMKEIFGKAPINTPLNI